MLEVSDGRLILTRKRDGHPYNPRRFRVVGIDWRLPKLICAEACVPASVQELQRAFVMLRKLGVEADEPPEEYATAETRGVLVVGGCQDEKPGLGVGLALA